MITETKEIFLRGVAAIYLFAFLSFYLQIPGLYGNDGILPARNQLQDSGSLIDKIHNKPTLLWLAPFLKLNTEYMMDVLSLLGIFLSFSAVLSQKQNTAPVFAALWSLYYSLYKVGQTFMFFQWDILLLEAGFLTILTAPLRYPFTNTRKQYSPGDYVTFFLPRWLLFRLMFSSGVVKLQSGCPTWWSLSALNVHFESQPLPTQLAWFMHHMPTWFLKLGTVHAQVVEQAIPFLFFFPNRLVRIIAFWNQIFLQFAIIISGNYNFFNFLTIVLCISLLDDEFFHPTQPKKRQIFSKILSIFIYGFIIYLSSIYYNLKIQPDLTISSDITFSRLDFDNFVHKFTEIGYIIAFCSLILYAVYEVYKCLSQSSPVRIKLLMLFVAVQYFAAAGFIFGATMVPHYALHPQTNSTIGKLRQLHAKIDHLHIANSYGLFRRMTGVNGRPEIVLEGSNDIQGPWIEYHFKYKPGDVNSSLSFVAPHQPRLDWQMWFAALGTYHQNPWLMSTAYHILNGNQNVLNLLDTTRIPFTKPPKYLKATLYHYHYTPWSQKKSITWWVREKVGEYFPIFTKDHAPLIDYLKSMNLLVPRETTENELKKVSPFLKGILDFTRMVSEIADPCVVIWSVVFIAAVIIVRNMRARYRVEYF